MSFADLKKQSKLGSLTQKLVKEVEKMNNTGGSSDDRLWKLECDKSGNGYAVIRFLPAPDGEDLPFVKLYSHAFQGPGGWLIDNCLTTNGDKCPVCAHNNGLWNSGVESDKDIARKQKRKLSYYSNVYVVKDPKHPENEGKVFLYKFGKKIHDKILAAMQPEFQDETPVNVFDFWEGANFKLKIKTVAGYWNYDSAEFDSPSALSADDDEMESLWQQAYSLEAFTNASEFKSYDALEDRLNNVLGLRKTASAPSFESEEYEPAPVSSSTADFNAPDITSSPVVEDDDALSYFAKLAAED